MTLPGAMNRGRCCCLQCAVLSGGAGVVATGGVGDLIPNDGLVGAGGENLALSVAVIGGGAPRPGGVLIKARVGRSSLGSKRAGPPNSAAGLGVWAVV